MPKGHGGDAHCTRKSATPPHQGSGSRRWSPLLPVGLRASRSGLVLQYQQFIILIHDAICTGCID